MRHPVIIGRQTISLRQLIGEGSIGRIADDLIGRMILHHDEEDVIRLVVVGRQSGYRQNSGDREIGDLEWSLSSHELYVNNPNSGLLRLDEKRAKNV